MKKQIHFFTLIFFTISYTYAQINYKLVYDYTLHSDSIKTDKIKNEEMLVIGNSNEYYYISNNNNVADSVNYYETEKGTYFMDIYEKLKSLPRSEFKSGIRIQENNKLTITASRLMDGFNLTTEFKQPNWILVNKTDSIANYKVKLATAYYLGRKWEAWYTEDIPLTLAPYTFIGLPGVIVRLKDSQNYFNWELKSVRNFDNMNNLKLRFEKVLKSNKFLSPVEFKAAFDDFDQNPMKYFENSGVSMEEEKYKRIENNYKSKKNRYLDIKIPKLL